MADSTVSLRWSAQFTVAPPGGQHHLQGDKINLPPSALEQLLSASSNLAAEGARQSLPTFDPYDSASFSAFRQAESQYQDQRQQLPYPLMFRLVNPENGRAIYSGIREFSADEGDIQLSPFLLDALGLDHGPASRETGIENGNAEIDLHESRAVITVHAKHLPKGAFVKLRPLEAGYDEDWKSVLEQHLRSNYTTLTKSEILVVPGGRNIEFRFLVDEFKPDADGVCVVDTDLEVDIEALNEEQARETLKRIAAKLTKAPGTEKGSSTGGELGIFKPQPGQVLPGEYVDYQLPSWDRRQPLEIQLDADDEDETLSLLISPFSPTQRARPRIDEFVIGDLESRPTKRIRLEPSNVEMENAEALYIAVHAFSPLELNQNGYHNVQDARSQPKRYSIRAKHVERTGEPDQTSEAENEVPPNEGEVRCKNCHQWVPQRTLMLHENFCLRNNILCPYGCGQVFQKGSKKLESHWHCPHDASAGDSPDSHLQHDTLFHPTAVLRCPDCSTSETFANTPMLAQHRTTVCPAKLILCRFCHLIVPQEGDPNGPNAEALLSGMTPHELADGARTTECHLCDKIVRLRDMATHLRNHDLDRLARPAPVPCRNPICGRTLDGCAKNGDTRAGLRIGQGAGNDIGLCSACFGPLYVSMYDPENKALRRRVERRYLQQLLTGCGKVWCKNEFCKAGRKNLGINANITTKDALPMVKPFLDNLTKHDTPLHFCVDEGSQKRRTLAEMLWAEDGGINAAGGYRLEWMVGAVEAANGDLDAARQWIKNWAPTVSEERRGGS